MTAPMDRSLVFCFLPLPGQVPCGCHCALCLLVAAGTPSQVMLLSDWSEQCSVLVAGAETSNKDPRKENGGGDGTSGRILVPLLRVDVLSPLHSSNLALKLFSVHRQTEPYTQAGCSLSCPLLAPGLLRWGTQGYV